MEIKNVVVDEKIYKFLSRTYRISFGNLCKFFKKGDIRVNGKKIDENYALREEDVININDFAMKILSNSKKNIKEKNNAKPSAEIIDKVKKSIIFEDDKIIAINKPYGLSVQGGSGIKISLDDVLPYLSDGTNKLRLVHRLDRDTTGVLIIAKNNEIAEILIKKFKERGSGIKKTYLAVVYGKLKNDIGTINLPLIKKYENNKEKVYVDKIIGKEAITNYKVVNYNRKLDISLVEVNIITGRTHQIRVHLKEIGNPVVGDFKYGKIRDRSISDKMLLHSYKIELDLGIDGETKYNLVAPIPTEFKIPHNFSNN
jgi:23S rRNA pseudouridine955/2504/2580 synthase